MEVIELDHARPRLAARQFFQSLDREAQRAYLAQDIILAERLQDGAVRAGEVIVSDDDGTPSAITF